MHTCIGDLKVDLVAPDGTLHTSPPHRFEHRQHQQDGHAELSTEALNGTWKLRVNDNASADTGYINSWSVTF